MTGRDVTTQQDTLRLPRLGLQRPDATPNLSAVWHEATEGPWGGPPEHRARNAALPAVKILEDARRELTAASQPQGPDSAARQAEILIGSYPAREINDPKVFVRAITSVLAEVPADIGSEAVDRLTRRLKFLPTRAEVAGECAELMRLRQTAGMSIDEMLREHERRRRRAPKADLMRDLPPEEQEERWARLKASLGAEPVTAGDAADAVVKQAAGAE